MNRLKFEAVKTLATKDKAERRENVSLPIVRFMKFLGSSILLAASQRKERIIQEHRERRRKALEKKREEQQRKQYYEHMKRLQRS
jgi:hypothetical protein